MNGKMNHRTRRAGGLFRLFMVWGMLVGLGGCAESRWYHGDERKLSGGGPDARLKAEHSFHFVVIGDTRTGHKVFEENIAEINQLDPDLVVDIGDLIGGYVRGDDASAHTAKIEAMWDDFDRRVEKFEVPLVMVAGNHDIWNPLSRKIYEQRYGRTYFSFDHKGVHFVALDTETLSEKGKPIGRIDEDQLEWLENDLAVHKDARLTFVFLHKPFWQNVHVAGGASEHWWGNVHPVLAKYGVSAVFAGHVHKYVKFPEIDGVSYYITGGGGVGIGSNPDQGDFHHYGVLTVRGESWKLAIIEPGSVKPDTIVGSDWMIVGNLADAVKITQLDPAEEGAKGFEIALRNPRSKPVTLTAKVIGESGTHWKIAPSAQTISIEPGKEGRLEFAAMIGDRTKIYPPPLLSLQVSGSNIKPTTVTRSVPVKSVQSTLCRQTSSPPTIDGKLDDKVWAEVEPVSSFLSPDGVHKAKYQTEVRLACDAENLYLAFRCHEPNMSGLVARVARRDGPAFDDDSVEIFIDTNLDRKTYYQFAFNANAFVYDGKTIDSRWNGEHTAKAGREAAAWTLEVAIPWKTLAVTDLKLPAKMGLEFVRNRSQSPSERTLWSPTHAGNHVPSQFGTMTIK